MLLFAKPDLSSVHIQPHHSGFRYGLILWVLFLGGCTHLTAYKPSETLQQALSKPASANNMTAEWWRTLGDKHLNQQIEKALQQNFSVQAAQERIAAAKAAADAVSANHSPELSITGNTRYQNDRGGDSAQYSAGLSASYEIDLWQRLQAGTDAAQLKVQASAESYRAAVLALSGDIALNWIKLIEARQQSELLQQQLRNGERTEQLLTLRYQTGQVRIEDILRQQLSNRALQAEQISMESGIKTLGFQLAILTGQPPQSVAFPFSLALPPAPTEVSIDASLLQRRPDVREALFSLAAADRDFAAAVSAQYPALTLSASHLSRADSPGALFSDWLTSLAGNLVIPLLDGQNRQARALQARARRNESVALYRHKVLQAMQETETALVQEQQQRRRIENLQQRLSLAESVHQQLRHGYYNGANSYLSVLSAEKEFNSLQRNLLSARRDLIESRIALHRAIAGDVNQLNTANLAMVQK